MNAPEHRERNRRLGLVLCLLFAGLFAIVTAAIVTGSKLPQSVESVVSRLIVPVLGIIGLLLIFAAIGEIIQNRRLAFILSLLLIGLLIIGTVASGIGTVILGICLVLLVIAAVVEIVLRILKNRVRE